MAQPIATSPRVSQAPAPAPTITIAIVADGSSVPLAERVSDLSVVAEFLGAELLVVAPSPVPAALRGLEQGHACLAIVAAPCDLDRRALRAMAMAKARGSVVLVRDASRLDGLEWLDGVGGRSLAARLPEPVAIEGAASRGRPAAVAATADRAVTTVSGTFRWSSEDREARLEA